MFGSKNRGTVIAKGLKIVGTVTAEGLVEVNGRVDGELHCTSLVISRGAHVAGTIAAGRVVVDGNVEGPIQGGDVILKSKAHVVGDIHHQSLSIESGAFFDGRSVHAGRAPTDRRRSGPRASGSISGRFGRSLPARGRQRPRRKRTPRHRAGSWPRSSKPAFLSVPEEAKWRVLSALASAPWFGEQERTPYLIVDVGLFVADGIDDARKHR